MRLLRVFDAEAEFVNGCKIFRSRNNLSRCNRISFTAGGPVCSYKITIMLVGLLIYEITNCETMRMLFKDEVRELEQL